MIKKYAVISFSMLLLIGTASALSARQPPPSDLGVAADARDKIRNQVESASAAAAAITGGGVNVSMTPGATPEKEIERRRKLINEAHRNFMNMKADARAPVGMALGASAEGGNKPLNKGLSDASASAGGTGDIAVATTSSREAVPEPPRAIPLEGRVVIDGGQADARAPRDQGAGISYKVEESFVGNLIVADKEPAVKDELGDAVKKGKLTPEERAATSASGSGGVELAGDGSLRAGSGKLLSKEYQIDTISTGVKVISLGGGACVKSDGGRGGECAEKDPFTKSEVSPNNSYGNFHDDVVAAESSKGKVKIEVAAPEVSFSSSGGKSAKLECSGAVFEMGADEIKQLIDNGSATFSRQVGSAERATSGCRPGSTITLDIKAKGK